MYIIFTHSDSHVGKQASRSGVHKKYTGSKNDPCCADVCAFLSMLMRVNIPPQI